MIVIKELAESLELDRNAMKKLKGGFWSYRGTMGWRGWKPIIINRPAPNPWPLPKPTDPPVPSPEPMPVPPGKPKPIPMLW